MRLTRDGKTVSREPHKLDFRVQLSVPQPSLPNANAAAQGDTEEGTDTPSLPRYLEGGCGLEPLADEIAEEAWLGEVAYAEEHGL